MKAALMLCAGLAVYLLVLAQPVRSQAPSLGPLDRMLDAYVRDGLVYYRALRSDRGGLDGYVEALANQSIGTAPREEQIAFWVNAYNALVLKTVIDNYPIGQRSSDLPAGSIRQVPGAFDRTEHRAGRQLVTLDQIEESILTTFDDPRVFLALGRGAVGSPRLRSEAYTAARLEEQLDEAARECVQDSQCIRVDRLDNRIAVSSIFSWREDAFVKAYADSVDPTFNTRSPLERAILGLVSPELLRLERAFVSANAFQVEFIPFDWSLNDLTGRGGL
jgi:hypothetical protein